MIYILFGENTLSTDRYISDFFNADMAYEWFDDLLVKRIVRDIDQSEVQGQAVVGPIGILPYSQLSTTSKTLIMCLKEEEYFEPDLISIGDNGFELFQEISKVRDIYCSLTGWDFTMDKCEDFDFCCVNDMSYGHGWYDWFLKQQEFLHSGEYKEPTIESVKGLVDRHEGSM